MQSLYLTVVVIIAWFVLCGVMWRLHKARQSVDTKLNSSVLIVYASQTGNAQTIAHNCAQALSLSTSSVMALNNVTLEHLNQVKKVLFVVSTYGDGEAPDNGNLFAKHLNSELPPADEKQATAAGTLILRHLQYSVIALGDSNYPEFCAFGFHVNQVMLEAKAELLEDVITVDNYDEQHTHLADITPKWLNLQQDPQQITAVSSPQYWQLTGREILNPGYGDEALLQLSFNSIGATPVWQAGDLVDIQPQHPVDRVASWLDKNNLDGELLLTHQGQQQSLKAWLGIRELSNSCPPIIDDLLEQLPYLSKRSYSVASVSENGQLQLVVRLLRKNDNSLGLASGYLGHYCQLGDIIQGQIKSITQHHNHQLNKPIILIGAGSGLAGLKAQLAARILAKQQGNSDIGDSWLIFGERNSDPQLPINQLLTSLKEKDLTKLSCAFSRDSQHPKYVQNILLNEQLLLKQWLDNGAVIYVCGCLSGMGESVQQTLLDILGQTVVEKLQQQGNYIRDVY